MAQLQAVPKVYCSVLGAHAVHVAMAGYTGIVVGKVDERCWAAWAHGWWWCKVQGPTWKLLRVVNGCGMLRFHDGIMSHSFSQQWLEWFYNGWR